MAKRILVSACLIGLPVRYDGKSNLIEKLKKRVQEGNLFFFCPEQAGGLSTPRDPAEIETGKTAKDVLEGKAKVITNTGKDVTKNFIEGAKMAFQLCRDLNIDIAILKARSPSCGSKGVYDGTFSRNLVMGNGITAELLKQHGVTVYTEEDYPESVFD